MIYPHNIFCLLMAWVLSVSCSLREPVPCAPTGAGTALIEVDTVAFDLNSYLLSPRIIPSDSCLQSEVRFNEISGINADNQTLAVTFRNISLARLNCSLDRSTVGDLFIPSEYGYLFTPDGTTEVNSVVIRFSAPDIDENQTATRSDLGPQTNQSFFHLNDVAVDAHCPQEVSLQISGTFQCFLYSLQGADGPSRRIVGFFNTWVQVAI